MCVRAKGAGAAAGQERLQETEEETMPGLVSSSDGSSGVAASDSSVSVQKFCSQEFAEEEACAEDTWIQENDDVCRRSLVVERYCDMWFPEWLPYLETTVNEVAEGPDAAVGWENGNDGAGKVVGEGKESRTDGDEKEQRNL